MERKSIKKNYVYNLCYQVLLLLTPLITTPYISRVLGADGIGTVSYAESIVSYFTLFATMGIATYGQREISYVQDSVKGRSVVFWNTVLLKFCTSFVVSVIYLMVCIFQPDPTIYLILVFNLLAVFFDVTWFFQGLEEFGKIVLRNILFKIINIIYVFVVIKDKEDIALYALGLALFLFLSNVSLWRYIPKYIIKIDKKDIHPFKDFRIILSLFLPTIAIQIYTVLDKTMIGVITKNTFENGYYEQALKLSKILLAVITSLGTVMVPRIGYFFQRKEMEEVKKLLYRSYHFVWFLGIPLCFGIIFVAENFVPWFFGEGFEKVITLLRILAFLILAIGISNVTGMQYLVPTKRQHLLTISVIIGAGVNFILNSILIRLYHSLGAALASVIAEILIAMLQIFLVRKELSILRILKEGMRYYIAGGFMAIELYLVGEILVPSIINTVIMIVCGAITYFVLLFIMKDDFFVSNVKVVLKKVKLIRRG